MDDLVQRFKFLSRYVKIYPGHWDEEWVLLTAPSVDGIVLDEEMTEATIDFTLVSQGGSTLIKRGPEGWEIVKSAILWQK